MVISVINHSEFSIYVPIQINTNTTGLVFILDNKKLGVEIGYISEIAYKTSTARAKPELLITNFYKYKKSDFTGTMTGYSIVNKFLWEMGYKGGDNIYKKKIVNLPNGFFVAKARAEASSKLPATSNTAARCTAFYLVTYWSDGSVDYEYIGGFCDEGGCEQTRTISKNSGGNFQAACGGGGGSGGGTSSTSSITEVKNKVLDPCLKAVVQKIVNSNLQNAVTDILQSIFSINDHVNITFESSLDYATPGHTVGYSNQGFINQDVYLNPSLLAGASQEFQASIIIHEIIHSALNVNNVASSLQHSEMLKNYIDKMSNSLVGFFPSLTLQQARSLSLQGLGPDVTNSAAFDSLIQQYGFNRIDSSPDNFANFALQYQFGALGTMCNTNIGVGGSPQN